MAESRRNQSALFIKGANAKYSPEHVFTKDSASANFEKKKHILNPFASHIVHTCTSVQLIPRCIYEDLPRGCGRERDILRHRGVAGRGDEVMCDQKAVKNHIRTTFCEVLGILQRSSIIIYLFLQLSMPMVSWTLNFYSSQIVNTKYLAR